MGKKNLQAENRTFGVCFWGGAKTYPNLMKDNGNGRSSARYIHWQCLKCFLGCFIPYRRKKHVFSHHICVFTGLQEGPWDPSEG